MVGRNFHLSASFIKKKLCVLVFQASFTFGGRVGEGGFKTFLHAPVLSGSLSYIFAKTFGWEQGLDKKFHEAKGFNVIIVISLMLRLSLNYIGIYPIKALIYTAILYGITAPILIAMILQFSNNKKIMGQFVNTRTANFFGYLALAIMSTVAVLLFYLEWLLK